jgi:transposase InsO family protein
VTDITYVSTYEGWLYVAVVIDLYSRTVVGWSMKSTLAKEIVLDAILMRYGGANRASPSLFIQTRVHSIAVMSGADFVNNISYKRV